MDLDDENKEKRQIDDKELREDMERLGLEALIEERRTEENRFTKFIEKRSKGSEYYRHLQNLFLDIPDSYEIPEKRITSGMRKEMDEMDNLTIYPERLFRYISIETFPVRRFLRKYLHKVSSLSKGFSKTEKEYIEKVSKNVNNLPLVPAERFADKDFNKAIKTLICDYVDALMFKMANDKANEDNVEVMKQKARDVFGYSAIIIDLKMKEHEAYRRERHKINHKTPEEREKEQLETNVEKMKEEFKGSFGGKDGREG